MEIRRHHGDAVAAILFYGSCLRGNTLDGVLDFYVLVDSYRAAYASPFLTVLNTALPPNVFYLEVQDDRQTLRAKYAVISRADFQHAATLRSVHAIVWGRFCQPFILTYTRDEQARATVIQAATEAVLTLVTRTVALLLSSHDAWLFQPESLWQRGFQETYRSELRPEHPATVRNLYEAAAERYDQVARTALHVLEQRGVMHLSQEGQQLVVTMEEQSQRRLRNAWRWRVPLAKVFYAFRLLKSACTFGDWLPYALWKLSRHTGVQVELTERQRRHPLLWGWPVIFKLLARRDLR
ncbi:MAG: hypothetical protein AB7P69_22420 [Candidatus Binatia bacterium]